MKASRSGRRHWRRATALVCLTALLAFVLGACGSDSDSKDTASTSGSAPAGGEVGYAGAQLSDAFQVLLVKLVQQQSDEQGVDLLPAVSADGDPAKQNADIATLLGRGIKGLIVTPVDSDAIVPAIEQANAKDVPVVTVNTGPNGGKVYMIVRANNYAMGEAGCEVMGERLKGKGNVVNMQGALTSADGVDRSKGFTDCMSKKYPDVKVTSKPMEWDPAKCNDILQTLLTSTQVDGVYMGSETICLPGLTQILKKEGMLKKVGESGHIVTVGIDGTPFGLEQVRAGNMDAVISQPIDQYARYAVKYIQAALNGETFEAGPTDHDSEIEALDGGSFVNYLSAVTVTSDNVDDPNLWGNAAK